MPESANDLLQKYNRARTHVAVLYDQLDKKTEELNTIKKEQERQDKMTRTFCQSILRKEHDVEPGGGKDKEIPWFKMSTIELLEKAEEVYTKKFNESAEKQKELANVYRDKLDAFAKLVKSTNKTIRELEEKLKEAKKKVDQNAAEDEKKQEKKAQSPIASSGYGKTWDISNEEDLMGAIEEDRDYNELDEMIQKDAQALNQTADGPKEKFPVTPAAQRVLDEKEKADTSKKIKKAFRSYIESATQSEKDVLLAIGDQGFSEFTELSPYMQGISDAKVRMCVQNLEAKGLLTMMSVNTPIKRNLKVFRLTELGRAIYERIAGKQATPGKVDKIKSEHGTLKHGYTIIQLSELLKQTPFVQKRNGDVICMNGRKQIKVGDGQAFVPDITITAENRQPVYIEYETTKCTPEDFSVKCDKFAKVTNWLNFVVPSQTALETIKTHAEDWIEKIKKERTLEKPVTINLSTVASIRKSEDPEMLKWDESIRANSTKQKNRKEGREGK